MRQPTEASHLKNN